MSDNTEHLELLLEELTALYKFVNRERIRQEKESFFKESDKRGKKGIVVKIYNLCDGQNTVSEIAKKTGLNQPNVSKKLAMLLDVGLIRKEGPLYVRNF